MPEAERAGPHNSRIGTRGSKWVAGRGRVVPAPMSKVPAGAYFPVAARNLVTTLVGTRPRSFSSMP